MRKGPRDLWYRDAGAPRSLLSLSGPSHPPSGDVEPSDCTTGYAGLSIRGPLPARPSTSRGAFGFREGHIRPSMAGRVGGTGYPARDDDPSRRPLGTRVRDGFRGPAGRTLPGADTAVETADWSVPIGTGAAEAGELCFVDGVRRVELRVLADEGAARAPGLFGSFAVGAVRCDGRAGFDEHRIRRALIIGGGLPAGALDIPAERRGCGSTR